MQLTSIHSQIIQNISNEPFLDTSLPKEILGVIFEQVINQSDFLGDISSILLTCQNWKGILEKNSCISLAQTLFQLQFSHRSTIKFPQECITTKQKQHFTSQELKMIDQVHGKTRFEKLLMVQSELFHSNSLFLSLLDRYPWDLEVCKKSANKNIQLVAKDQLSILDSLIAGSDDQKLTIIKNDFIKKFYNGGRGQTWDQAKKSVISTFKNLPNFNDKKIFIKIARCFTDAVFYIHERFKKDREIVLAAVQQNGWALQFADESLKKDRAIVLAAVKQYSWALRYADETLQKDREIVLAAVKQIGDTLQLAHETLKKDREIVLAAVKQNGVALQYADESFKKDREVVSAAIQQDGRALRYVDENLKKDRKIVLMAVKQNPLAIQHADLTLQIELINSQHPYITLSNQICKFLLS